MFGAIRLSLYPLLGLLLEVNLSQVRLHTIRGFLLRPTCDAISRVLSQRQAAVLRDTRLQEDKGPIVSTMIFAGNQQNVITG